MSILIEEMYLLSIMVLISQHSFPSRDLRVYRDTSGGNDPVQTESPNTCILKDDHRSNSIKMCVRDGTWASANHSRH